MLDTHKNLSNDLVQSGDLPKVAPLNSHKYRPAALLALIYLLFLLLFVSGIYQKLYIGEDNRLKYHAIPVAISTLYQGHKHDYRGWRSTAMPFQSSNQTDGLIAEQINQPVQKTQGHYYWVADDRGYADIVIAAFYLFGPKLKSLYCFWFLIFALSTLLFTISFRKKMSALACLAFLLLGIHSSMSLLQYHISVPWYEPRYLDVLALVSVFHLVFASTFFSYQDLKRQIFGLLAQLVIFLFLYHARSSLGWEILAIITVSTVACFTRKSWNKLVPLSVIVITLSGLGMLNGYKHLKYHKSYFQEMGVRTFWHNALMGLDLKCLPLDRVNDYVIAKLIIQFAKESSSHTSGLGQLTPQELLNTLGNHGTANWTDYEKFAKKLYLALIKQNFFEAMKVYCITKPLNTLRQLQSPPVILFDKPHLQKRALPWHPLNWMYLSFAVLILCLSLQSLYLDFWNLFFPILVLLITSMIPSVAFYSDILTRGGLSTMSVLFLYLVASVCMFRAYHMCFRESFITEREMDHARRS